MASTRTLSQAWPLDSRLASDGHLLVGGCDAVELAREYGTPAFVVAEEDLRSHARAFTEALRARHADGEVAYATKAFPCTAAMRLFAEEGLSCDVASGGELHLALEGGFDPARIYLHGNAKDDSEIEYAQSAGVGHVVLDGWEDLERVERLTSGRQRVLLRVTPGVAGETHAAISTGQRESKFGFPLADASAAIERVQASERLELEGLHMHIGSQILDLEPFRRAVAAIAPVARFPTINVGGGLGVAYRAEDRPPSIEEWVDGQVRAVHELIGSELHLVLEPGRALVANAGVTLYTVVTVKRGEPAWVAVDGGMSDNLRPMLYGAAYEAEIADRPAAEERIPCRVVGKHCESGDVLIREVGLPDPLPGDVLVTPVTGAYGHALANNYNAVPRPPVLFCRAGEARVVVRREGYDDLTARDLP